MLLSKLRDVRDLIADPEHWTTGAYARNGKGNPIGIDSTSAVRWCLIGACIKLEGPCGLAYSALSLQAKGKLLLNVNDFEGHAGVLALIDKAIRRAS